MKWSGNQNADGFQLLNYREETLAAKPVYSSPDDEGRKIFVDTPGADYGEWVGSEDAGDWVRPAGFGGGGGYTEPGLLCWFEPQLMTGFGQGFAPGTPAIVYTARSLAPTEELVLLAQTDADGLGTPITIGAGTILFQGAYGDQFENVVWWNEGLWGMFGVFQISPEFLAKMVVWDNVSGEFLDGMTVLIEAGGPP